MKRIPRRLAIAVLTGPAGRLAAFALDLLLMGGAYLVARLSGKRLEPWDKEEEAGL